MPPTLVCAILKVMKLIVGLGNPGTTYHNTRHNLGVWSIDHFCKQQELAFISKNKFKSLICEYKSPTGEKIIIMKPNIFYNLSGEAVKSVADFYNIADKDTLIVHDELSLPLGSIRARIGGSDAGNNGMKSITAQIGHESSRIRIGISIDGREQIADADFVLGKLSKDEMDILDQLTPEINRLILKFVNGSFEPETYSLTNSG